MNNNSNLLDNFKNIKDIFLLSYTILKNYRYFITIHKLDNSKKEKFRQLEKYFYDLIENISYKTLLYNKELNNNKSNNKYLVIVTTNNKYFNIFRTYLLFYYINLKINKCNTQLGIDYEFNSGKIALMQLNFEQPRKDLYNKSFIFIVEPKQFNIKWKLFFIRKILCNKLVLKILHGSESLDLPYMYNELFNSNNKYIIDFTKSMIDTKYLCEYSYYSNNQPLGKCKIYSLLLTENIINQQKYNELLENEEKMGPIYNITIDISKMNDNLVNYTLYDVLFLPALIDKYISYIQNYKLIQQITNITFFDKRQIIEPIPNEEINKINNYFIFIDKPYRLSQLYDIYIKKSNNKILIDVLKINYFKKTISSIIKYEIYRYLSLKYKIYINFSKDNKIEYNYKILSLSNNYYPLQDFIKFIEDIKNDIINFINNLKN